MNDPSETELKAWIDEILQIAIEASFKRDIEGDLTLERLFTLGCGLAVLRTDSNRAAAALRLMAAKVEGGIYDSISGEIRDESQRRN